MIKEEQLLLLRDKHLILHPLRGWRRLRHVDLRKKKNLYKDVSYSLKFPF